MKNFNIESIIDLNNSLLQTELKSKLSFSNNILTILFHEDFKIEICFNKSLGLFNTYINSIFYYGIETMDIFDFIKDLSKDLIVIQYKKMKVFRRPFKFIPSKSFNKSDWENIKDVKIFNSTKVLLNNYN